MARPKGSKNKPRPEEPSADELLGEQPKEEIEQAVKSEVKEEKPKRMVGYHPITGKEVWI